MGPGLTKRAHNCRICRERNFCTVHTPPSAAVLDDQDARCAYDRMLFTHAVASDGAPTRRMHWRSQRNEWMVADALGGSRLLGHQ